MNEVIDPSHAWFVLGGVLLGLLLALGGVAFAAHQVRGLLKEAGLVVDEMKKVVAQAHGIALNVANNYVPLLSRVNEIEREVRSIRDMLKHLTGDSA